MDYPFKYVVVTVSSDTYSEHTSYYYFNDYLEANSFFLESIENDYKSCLYRIMAQDNFFD